MVRRSIRLSTKVVATSPPTTASTPPIPAKPKPKSKPTAKVDKKDPPTIYFPSPAAFNTWLLANTSQNQGIWLKIAKKASSIPTITYDQAIDTALCHGWIDGQRKALDTNYFIQRFTPRRKNSLWSKRNVDKVAVLIDEGRMQATGLAEVHAAKADGRWDRAYAGPATMEVPGDFAEALAANKKARDVFDGLGRSARFPFLWRVTTAKTEETRRRKIEQFVDMLSRGETL
ncbi:hypothetical protein VFPPC_14813 [Pochonia chlamydosporia 170]|uniref:Bacteriocin-protection, ydeI or ompD-Associated domain-containing protein n=1 Tax=Pochonia chlamydosporia 170 TaxID=1380566 RepID=A0A179F562_METCM|nr:hypothetical protein VFPPC_14813 [Pochonia chlamydosporia 170]OAQ60313.1 hypothetical protein VFPPC_14813 [Pochonia chlamydosporia 170]